jgi:hypothetical protein
MGTPNAPAKSFLQGTLLDFLLIALLWSIAVFLVNPVGEFPLNDDWSWSMTAKRLAEGHGYQPGSWSEMTLFTHALWGALFCLPSGFSFTALRYSTLALSLVGVFGIYALVRQLQRPRWLAIVCALTLVFNPLYFALSNSYMADVPFTTLVVFSALFFIRHLQKQNGIDLVLATTFALAATLSRQMGLCVPFAFGVALCLKHRLQRCCLFRAFIPALTCFIALVAYQYWLKATGKPPPNNIRTERLWAALSNPRKVPINLVYYGWCMLMYLGWFLLPVVVLTISRVRDLATSSRPNYPARIALFIFFAVSMARFMFIPSLMPVHNNVIIPQGIGPATLRDTFDLQLPHLPAWPTAFWFIVTALSLAGAAILIFNTFKNASAFLSKNFFAHPKPDTHVGIFLLLASLAYLMPFLLSGFFDRYLIPVTAFLAVGISALLIDRDVKFSHPKFIAAILLIIGSGFFAIVGTRDYLEWNRARWRALDHLVEQDSVKPEQIDGGFEFNGWNSFDDLSRTNSAQVAPLYIVSFGDIEGYNPISTNSYINWMPPREGQILVLKRNDN